MKKRLLTLLLALALAVSLALPAAAAQTPVEVSSALELAQAMAEPVSARGRFRSRAAAAEPTRVVAFAPALADGYGADRVLHLAAWQEYVLEFSDAAAAQRALARLRSDPDVTDCFLDEAVTADDTLAGLWDETASRSWGGHEMGLTTLRHQADVLLPAGRRATVAVIDTGAEVSHPLLAGRVSARSYDFADNTADVTDVNGHGTATAGLVADLTPDEVDVMVLRVYGDDNLSKPSRVLTALEYALENGATVVNMSIGWPNAIEKGYSFLNSVLAQAYAAGVVVVAAAGNLSQSNPTANADDVYPANQAQVLTVSAVDRSRTFDDTYSASGASVDLCAPGTGVAVAALSGAIEEVNRQIYHQQEHDDALTGMGTTLSVLWMSDNFVYIGHVGDSRVYLLRDGEFKQMTLDHSLVEQLVREGVLTEEEAQNHPMRNIITRAIGTDESVEVDVVVEERRKGDLWLACSDGLHGLVDDRQMRDALRQYAPEKAADVLLKAALDAGGRDNVTLVIVHDGEEPA